jgi:hypothetical protein
MISTCRWLRYSSSTSSSYHLTYLQTQAAGQVAIYITLGLSKTATILIGRRVFTNDMKNSRLVCNIITGVIVLWTLVSAVLVSVGCSATSISPKTSSQVCPGIESRYLFVVITDALTDILLSVTPAYLCRRLNMSMWLKLQVLGIFALRLPLIALSGLFFAAWKYSLHNVNPGVARTPALTFQQAQLCLSILVGTIPSLKAFIQSFDTGSGAKAGMGYTSHSGDVDGSRTAHNQPLSGEGSYHLARLTRNLRDTSGDGASASNDGIVRVNRSMSFMKARRTLTEEGVELARSSSHESDRRSLGSTQEMFIRKDIEWMVTSEAARSGSDVNIPGILRLPM